MTKWRGFGPLLTWKANGKKLMGIFLIPSLTLVPHAGLSAPGKRGKSHADAVSKVQQPRHREGWGIHSSGR